MSRYSTNVISEYSFILEQEKCKDDKKEFKKNKSDFSLPRYRVGRTVTISYRTKNKSERIRNFVLCE